MKTVRGKNKKAAEPGADKNESGAAQPKILPAARFAFYLAGVFSVSLGIILCKKCGLGISPISSVPYVLEDILPIGFGTLTMLFHFVNTGVQIGLKRRAGAAELLQIPLAVLFGVLISLIETLMSFEITSLPGKILALLLSVFFTALGMVLMVNMQLVQNPPDGTVKVLSERTGRELGRVKILYDVTCVVLSLGISLAVFHDLRGFGVATIVSALTVGKLVSLMNPAFRALVFGERSLRKGR